MNLWFEIKAGKRSIDESGLVSEDIEASQLCVFTCAQDTAETFRFFKPKLAEVFQEAVEKVELDLKENFQKIKFQAKGTIYSRETA